MSGVAFMFNPNWWLLENSGENMAVQCDGGKPEQKTEGERWDSATFEEALHPSHPSHLCQQEQWRFQWSRGHTHRARIPWEERQCKEEFENLGDKLYNKLSTGIASAQGSKGSRRIFEQQWSAADSNPVKRQAQAIYHLSFEHLLMYFPQTTTLMISWRFWFVALIDNISPQAISIWYSGFVFEAKIVSVQEKLRKLAPLSLAVILPAFSTSTFAPERI